MRMMKLACSGVSVGFMFERQRTWPMYLSTAGITNNTPESQPANAHRIAGRTFGQVQLFGIHCSDEGTVNFWLGSDSDSCCDSCFVVLLVELFCFSSMRMCIPGLRLSRVCSLGDMGYHGSRKQRSKEIAWPLSCDVVCHSYTPHGHEVLGSLRVSFAWQSRKCSKKAHISFGFHPNVAHKTRRCLLSIDKENHFRRWGTA